jgi:hypothetical protein
MKKLIGIVVILAALGAAAWFLLGQGPNGATPALAKTMPTATTAGLAGVQGLDQLSKSLLTQIEKIPAEQRKAMGPMAALADAAERTKMIGFDPATAEGWATLGVDPTAGFSVAVDARLLLKGKPLPVLLFKVTDQAKLLAFVEAKAGVKPTVDESKAPLKILKINDKPVGYFGVRQGWTAVLMQTPDRVKDLEAAFTTYLGETTGDLANNAAFKQSFGGAKMLQLFGYLNSQAVLGILETIVKAGGLPKTLPEDGKFYVDLFPGASLWAGGAAGGGRLVASEKGVELIRKLFAPAKGPAKFSQFVPAKGYSAMRLSINLKDLFAGIGDALPPSMAKMKSQIGMAPMAVAMIGLNWADLTAAFSGHFVVAGDIGASMAAAKDPNQAKVVALIGLNDTAKADELVPTLLGLASKGGGMMAKEGPKPEAIELDGHKGQKLALGPISLVVVRVDKVLVAGPEAAVKAALAAKKGTHLSHKEGVASLDGDDVIEGIYYDAESLAKAMATSGDPDAAILTEALKGQLIAGAVRHDKKGVYWRSEGAGLTSMVGMFAAIAVPAFTKYIERSKQAERQMIEMQKKHAEEIKKLEAAP